MAAEQIKVRVSGKGPLKKYVPGGVIVIPKGSTASMLVSRFRIPDGHRVLCMRDGKRISPSIKLHHGDHIILISMLPGG